MSTSVDRPAAQRPLLSLEDVAAAAFTIEAGSGLTERAARLLAMIRTWAEPAAVIGVVRDPSAESGLRMLPELSVGHVGQGQERTLARLVDEAGPARLAVPWLIPPPREVAGYRVKALDSWLIPWSGAERSSGFLLLRGVAAPYPANLAQAVTLAARGVWALVPAPTPAGGRPAAEGGPRPGVAAAEAASAALDASPEVNSGNAEERGAPVPRALGHETRASTTPSPDDAILGRLAKLEAAARGVQALVDELRQEQDRRASVTPAATLALREGVEAVEHARRDALELREQCEALDRARAEAESERDQAQVEATSWHIQAEELRARLEHTSPSGAVEASAAPEALERARAEAESARDQAQVEATSWRIQAEELRARLERASPSSAVEASAPAEALEAARHEAAGLRERVSELESALESARAEATALREQLAERGPDSGDTAELRAQLAAERTRNEADRHALEGARQALKISEEMLAGQTGELESVRRQRANLQEQIESAQRARAAAEAERDRARAEVNPLWGTIESLQRQIKDQEAKLGADTAELASLKAEHEQLRAQLAELRASAAQAAAAAGEGSQEDGERARQAEERAAAFERRWDESVGALRAAFLALKRTPFVPPTLRLSFAGAQALFDAEDASAPRPDGAGAGKRTRVLMLDRDTPSLEALAAELEAEGVDVLVAHYADEAAFFLKTPEARQLTALVADVMAFRSDAEMLERFRVWRLDMPGLGLVVSYRADDVAETERAKRLPLALGAGHVARPLARQPLLDTVALAARRAGKKAP